MTRLKKCQSIILAIIVVFDILAVAMYISDEKTEDISVRSQGTISMVDGTKAEGYVLCEGKLTYDSAWSSKPSCADVKLYIYDKDGKILGLYNSYEVMSDDSNGWYDGTHTLDKYNEKTHFNETAGAYTVSESGKISINVEGGLSFE